ncbi:MAG: hypothetical protein Q4F57_08670, partial [Weeksellaceae bacterium]|nr:hypothetical protein [Weeksellaceae bacterium]
KKKNKSFSVIYVQRSHNIKKLIPSTVCQIRVNSCYRGSKIVEKQLTFYSLLAKAALEKSSANTPKILTFTA